ncbi:hypothetical protein PHYSODRAFT_331095 [Phytophthora sojae]|uniref:RxLR effector protein n=1 Tax=Phytophthora sojae (strain P6497) TaxID=1094619 RepID=G4ZG11_PHYSP|nr:hypothetical protein PHYSODRAFT_331095 [Phytophthora sojae]EGZ17078.1 hypothetical protein PHYSODRAFT_331095 [Phytophthora sojae]|eukprot:XP_009526136.1 hypothetical protein PHYSODRAFT_331095 [Phytophthora sojae]
MRRSDDRQPGDGEVDSKLLRSNSANVNAADAEDEERVGALSKIRNYLARNDFDMSKLSKMMDSDAYKMNLDNPPQFKKLLLDYLNNYQRKATKVKKVKPAIRVRPDVKRVTFSDAVSVQRFNP